MFRECSVLVRSLVLVAKQLTLKLPGPSAGMCGSLTVTVA